MRKIFLFVLLAIVLTFGVQTPADAWQQPMTTVRILSSDGTERSSFSLATANQIGGLSVAVADLGSDEKPEIILGNGLGNEPRVHVYRADGSEVGSFLAYDAAMGVGVNVVACDLDGNGINEIVTAPQRGGGPHVRVFDNFGTILDPGFFAYAESMREGVNLACGDLDGDSRAEIVTLPASGAGPHVRVWKRNKNAMEMSDEFFAFDQSDRRGLVGTIENGNLIVASQRGTNTDIQTYVIHSPTTRISTSNVNTNARGVTSIVSRDGENIFATSQGATLVGAISKFEIENSANESAAAAMGDVDGDGIVEYVVTESRPFVGDDAEGKRIVIDLSEQRLYTYQNGLLDNSFLVSTARPPYSTPLGEHSILAKIPLVHYAGGTGADAYDLGWIPYNLRFYPHVYIHYAPWHNNFGHVMSHGCVNVSLENIKWIYEWATEGIPVIVQS